MNVLETLKTRVANLKEWLQKAGPLDQLDKFDDGQNVTIVQCEAYQDEIAFLEPIIKHLTEVQEKEKETIVDLSDLHTRRRKIAENRYNLHEFESPVASVGGWETVGNVFSRIVFLDDGSFGSARTTFTVTFKPDSDIVVE